MAMLSDISTGCYVFEVKMLQVKVAGALSACCA